LIFFGWALLDEARICLNLGFPWEKFGFPSDRAGLSRRRGDAVEADLKYFDYGERAIE
jgi:hypothetical protein